ncbi:hypothetical protein NPIL_95051 [Nephila pilipes]|uniref:Uncharacterized protein n=1 Tax=Nephila pilipes TaxID=299642 RepID=A0A8X6T8Q7_NEPPI|nr:hypothetical protein NPIL_95051 [Nephila pilipes]
MEQPRHLPTRVPDSQLHRLKAAMGGLPIPPPCSIESCRTHVPLPPSTQSRERPGKCVTGTRAPPVQSLHPLCSAASVHDEMQTFSSVPDGRDLGIFSQ